MKIAIIGGGASGLVAAITAVRLGADVYIFEKNDRLGKKVLATGNGRCNLSNEHFDINYYKNPSFVEHIFGKFDKSETIKFFDSLGIMTIRDLEGRLYPRTEHAGTVVDAMRFEIENLGVRVYLDTNIVSLEKSQKGITLVDFYGKKYIFDSVIVSTGGIAPKGEIFPLPLKIVNMKPSLVPMISKDSFVKGLNGQRVKCLVTCDKYCFKETGEILFKDYGVSGIVIFNLSACVSRISSQIYPLHIMIDLLPEFSDDRIKYELVKRIKIYRDASKCMIGMLNNKIAYNLLIKSYETVPNPDALLSNIDVLVDNIKRLDIIISGTKGFSDAQVTSGGYDVSELNRDLSVKSIRGLYLAGEIIDVDGICGGYNLQWAWSSGVVAALNAVRFCKNVNH